MFKTYANLKHSYLHKWLKCEEPGETNRFLEQVMQWGPNERPVGNLLHTLASMQPASFAVITDLTKAQLAYGRWGVPQLITQMISSDRTVSYRALGTLADETIDPEKSYRAIQCRDVVPHLSDVLEKLCTEDALDTQIIERILSVMFNLAGHLIGADQLLAQPMIIKNLYLLMKQDVFVQETAKVWAQVAGHYMMAELMVLTDHLPYMREAIEQHNEVYELYDAIAYLIERNPTRAMQTGFFEFLFPLLHSRTPCQPIILKCFALLVQCDLGQKMCDSALAIPRLLYVLNDCPDCDHDPTLDWRPLTMSFEYAAMALHNCLISSRSRWMCQQYWDMPLILVKHAHCKTNDRLQVHCLQVLRHITEKPCIKRFVGTVCKSRIKRINCPTNRVRKAKLDLLEWLQFRNYHNEDPTSTDCCESSTRFYTQTLQNEIN